MGLDVRLAGNEPGRLAPFSTSLSSGRSDLLIGVAAEIWSNSTCSLREEWSEKVRVHQFHLQSDVVIARTAEVLRKS